jgi:hypothetical protein
MINDFLATLDNIAAAPAGIIWPSFTPRVITDIEATVRAAIIGVNLSREQNISRCLQLADLVAQSPLASYLTARDPRITYSRAAIQSRFAVSGPVVIYTGSQVSPAVISFQALPTTPDIDSWVLQPLNSSTLNILDDRGTSTSASVAFSGGLSNPIALPNGGGQIQLVGTAIAINDSWQLSYRAPGATWVSQALLRMSSIEPRSLMIPDVATWYNQSLLQLDKLAAIVVALGTR